MRVRRMDANGNYVFGSPAGTADPVANTFWIDQPEGVAQVVLTRLRLLLGEWYGDTSDGTPWATEVLGAGTASTRDVAIRSRILGTPGVTGIENYNSTMIGRQFSVSMTLNTIYGSTPFQQTL